MNMQMHGIRSFLEYYCVRSDSVQFFVLSSFLSCCLFFCSFLSVHSVLFVLLFILSSFLPSSLPFVLLFGWRTMGRKTERLRDHNVGNTQGRERVTQRDDKEPHGGNTREPGAGLLLAAPGGTGWRRVGASKEGIAESVARRGRGRRSFLACFLSFWSDIRAIYCEVC